MEGRKQERQLQERDGIWKKDTATGREWDHTSITVQNLSTATLLVFFIFYPRLEKRAKMLLRWLRNVVYATLPLPISE